MSEDLTVSPEAATAPADCQVTICNERGLHARAAARFVKTVESFDAEVTVTRQGQTVCGRSIMGLMMLAAGPGTDLQLQARGPDATTALAAVADLVSRRFDEAE